MIDDVLCKRLEKLAKVSCSEKNQDKGFFLKEFSDYLEDLKKRSLMDEVEDSKEMNKIEELREDVYKERFFFKKEGYIIAPKI